MRTLDMFPLERKGYLYPRDTYEVCPRPSLGRYDLPGVWEPVQRSAQRVYQSGDDYIQSASRLHGALSGLHLEDEFDGEPFVQDRHSLHGVYSNRRSGMSDGRYPETYSRTNNGKFSKPVRRVVHESRDRMIPIPVQHVITIPDDKYLDLNRNAYDERLSPLTIQPNENIRSRRDFIDLSDEGDEVSEDSFSDQSDCDIYPFVSRNLNNNVRTRRSCKRSEPYSIDHRRKSPSPERDCTIVPHSSSPGRSRHRSQDRDIVCLSDLDNHERKRKEKDNLSAAPHYSGHYEHDTLRRNESRSNKIKTGSLPSSSLRHRSKDKYFLIEDDQDSAFSINQAYTFSDDENMILDKDLKFGKNTCDKEKIIDSRHSSDSDEGITATPSYPAYNIIRDMIQPEGRQVDYIRGDGNCFFRALSKVIYNTESCHEEIRQAVVDLMEKYPKDFEQFIDGNSLHDHIKFMRKTGTWGTQAEIYGAATLLQRDLYILSPDPSGKRYRWLLFSPRFKQTDVNCFDLCYITLCHTNGNHYDRIAPLVGKCNCALLPPQLSGVKERVDLTTESEEDLIV